MAATTLASNYSLQPRASTETDRRQLLAESIAPSESSSIISHGDGDRTPRAHSPAPSTTGSAFRIPAGQRHDRHASIATPAPQPYRGFPSEAHYLAALNEWAESKKYIQQTDTTLYGFYGETTMEEYASRPKMEGLGLRRKWKARKEAKQEGKGSRRNTVT